MKKKINYGAKLILKTAIQSTQKTSPGMRFSHHVLRSIRLVRHFPSAGFNPCVGLRLYSVPWRTMVETARALLTQRRGCRMKALRVLLELRLNDTGPMHSTQGQNENAGEKWRLTSAWGVRARCQSKAETLKEKDDRPEGCKPQKIAETLHLGGWGRKSKGLKPVWTTLGNFTSETKHNTSTWINNIKDTLRQTPCWGKVKHVWRIRISWWRTDDIGA